MGKHGEAFNEYVKQGVFEKFTVSEYVRAAVQATHFEVERRFNTDINALEVMLSSSDKPLPQEGLYAIETDEELHFFANHPHFERTVVAAYVKEDRVFKAGDDVGMIFCMGNIEYPALDLGPQRANLTDYRELRIIKDEVTEAGFLQHLFFGPNDMKDRAVYGLSLFANELYKGRIPFPTEN